MSTMEHYDADSATERLLEHSWAGRERRASERELLVDAVAAALFCATAGAFRWPEPGRTRPPGGRLLLVAVYALVVPDRVPARRRLRRAHPADPRADAADLAAGGRTGRGGSRHGDRERRRLGVRPRPSAARPVGGAGRVARGRPRGRLLAAGSPTIGFGQLPLLGLALAAGFVLDLASSLVRMRLAGVGPSSDCRFA